MSFEDSGFFGSSLSRTRSLIHNYTLQPWVPSRTCSFQFYSNNNRKPRLDGRPSQSSDHLVMLKSPLSARRQSKRGRAAGKDQASKKGTILRAVPAATACATAPLSPMERDMATLPNEEVLASIGRTFPLSPQASDGKVPVRSKYQNSVHRSHTRSSSGTALSTIPAGTEMQFPELKGTIGIYRHGRIQWEQRDKSSAKTMRPEIKVVIPTDQRNRPLPTSPFFGQSPFSQNLNKVTTPSDTLGFGYDISPPSDTKGPLVRDSVVSPLSSQQQRHPLLRFQTSAGMRHYRSESALNSAKQGNTPSRSHSSDDSQEDDLSSVYSKSSSISSVEAESPNNFQERTLRATCYTMSSREAGISYDNTGRRQESEAGLPRRTSPPPRRYGHHPPIVEDVEFIPTCDMHPRAASNTLQHRSNVRHPSNRVSQRRSLSANHELGVLNQAVYRSSFAQITRNIPSPTLSEAENDLERQLTSFTEEDSLQWDEVVPPPALPRKSSKRQSPSIPAAPPLHTSSVPGDHIVSQFQNTHPIGKGKGLTIDTVKARRITTDTFVLSPFPIPPVAAERAITPDVAETVILNILRNLETFDDLFATAIINRGFYRVFQRHELELMKCTLRRMSPPAWEHREICYPGHDQVEDENIDAWRQIREYTPTSYIRHYTRDMYIIAAIKSLITDKCQSFLRPEMAVALIGRDSSECTRVDDALWRVWTFCKIFGSGKGREDDIVAQMDWLKGGELVHQKTCTFSILTTESINMNGAFASEPECFGLGNEGGLTAEQLFDMMELWNCLGVLLQGFSGRSVQAREYGVFDNTEVRGGDIDGEEMMLDEWYYYLLTLGLSPILNLAAPCRLSDSSAFVVAANNGWTNWSPPVFGGTRRNFLKEAASRVYEDKITITYAETSTRDIQRQLSKQRIQRHITELRNQKNNSERLVPIRMSQERPISEWENVINNLTRPRPSPAPTSNLVSHIPTLHSTTLHPTLPERRSASVSELPALETLAPPNTRRPRSPSSRTVAQPLLPTPPPSTVPSLVSDRRSSTAPSTSSYPASHHNPSSSVPEMPLLSDHPAFAAHRRTKTGSSSIPSFTPSTASHPSEDHPAFQQHYLQRTIYQSDATENTTENAVFRIVEMGFTPEQARRALRMTDMGDGLRVDRAVEMLLRGE